MQTIIPELGLVCLLKSEIFRYRTTTASSKPNVDKLQNIYQHNIAALQNILNWCHSQKIGLYRIPSSLFPLATHPDYEQIIHQELLPEVFQLLQGIEYHNIVVTSHPDQFVVLSSLNPKVVASSQKEIEFWASLPIPFKVINVHIGSAASKANNVQVLAESIRDLSSSARAALSLENDEKSYSFLEVLEICTKLGIKCVPDFHHERCFQRRQSNYTKGKLEIDDVILQYLPDVAATYLNQIPVCHISSPRQGWNGKFKEECQHADFIQKSDYLPLPLPVFLEVEAKAKEEAIKQLKQDISH